jgi:hypothetical protein
MNMNDAVKFNSIVRRNLRRKNVYLWPLRLPSLLGITMGILMLMAMAAPSAHAALLTFFDFENAAARTAFNTAFPPTPYPADGGQAGVTLSDGPDNPFPNGQIIMDATGGNPNGVLDLQGNNSAASPQFCFSLGALNTTGLGDITLSFDLKSVDGPQLTQFSTLTLLYSTTAGGGAGTFTSFETITDLKTHPTYFTYSFNVSSDTAGAVNNQSTLYFEFCFSGATTSESRGFTFIDNIQVTGVPEPSTYIGGLLGIAGLCWFQRRWLVRFRRA